jgi:hypothetical protein
VSRKSPAFLSYAREDSAFVLRLAADLKARGANVWMDQLDIPPGRQWDREVERALNGCTEMLVILSPAAVSSNNVMDEVAFALEEGKTVIPILQCDCRIPFRLRRLQRADLAADYELGLQRLLGVLAVEDQVAPEGILRAADGPREASDQAMDAEQERIEREKAEAVRKAEQEQIQREKSDAARKAEQERIEREKAAAAVRPTPAAIVRILQSYASERGFHVHPGIPSAKLKNARESCSVADEEQVLGLIDCSSFGSAKQCLLFGGSNLYIRTPHANLTVIPYSRIAGMPVRLGSELIGPRFWGPCRSLFIGSEIEVQLDTARFPVTSLKGILDQIRNVS